MNLFLLPREVRSFFFGAVFVFVATFVFVFVITFVFVFTFVFVLAFAARLKSHQPICVDVWPGAVWHPVSSVSVSRQPVNVHQDSQPTVSAAGGARNSFQDG